MSEERVNLQFEIHEEAAKALAQFLKRVTFDDWYATTDPSKSNDERIEEAYMIKSGCSALQRGLAAEGFCPR
jgi:hypothetical protein